MARFRRRGRTRDVRPWIVIACEGAVTEPTYFGGIRMQKRLSDKLVRIVHEGSDPRSVVRLAIAEGRQAEREHGKHALAQTWAVFDGDEHRQEPGQRQMWNDAIQLAVAKGVRLAISNPCFELWYLLHFQEQRAHVDRDEVVTLLWPHCGDTYAKGDRLLDGFSEAMEAAAAARADACCAGLDGLAGFAQFANPSTRVQRLMRALRSIPGPSGVRR